MQKIRVTKTPKTGDQRDYSLVHRQAHYIGEGDSNTLVKNTMGAVPKEEANIEVEGGETVVGDVNRDGFLEHMTFVGKKHSQGGVPVNIPEGSFIFSDTKKLKIKDREILDKIFGLSFKKGGYTPAEIAKRYQINNYIQDLKSEDTDPITKRSATQMLANNMEKLGQLALIQESMKGFPDGVPAIAESVMAGLQESMPQEPQAPAAQAKFGGLKKFPDGGKFELKYTPQTTIYINGVPFKYSKHEDAFGWGTGDIVTFKSADGRYYKTNSEDLAERVDSGKEVDLGYKNGRVNKAYVTSAPGKSFYDANSNNVGGKTFKKGTQFYADGKLYEVEDPYAAYTGTSQGYSGVSPTTLSTVNSGAAGSYNTPGLKVYEVGADGKRKGSAVVLPESSIATSVRNNTFDYHKYASSQKTQVEETRDAGNPYATSAATPVKTNTPAAKTPAAKTPPAKTPAATGAKPAGAAPARPTGKPKTAQDALNYFRSGGELAMYVDAGNVTPGPGDPPANNAGTLNTTVANQEQINASTNQRIDPNKEIFVGDIQLEDGTVVKAYYKGSQKYVKDASGNILASGTRTDTQFEQYGSANINQILAKTPNVKYTTTNFGSFGQQPNVKGTGIYLSSGNAQARSNSDLSPEEWADFQDRHGDWIEKEYPGGFAAYKQNLQKSKATGDQAAAWFQDKINEKSMKQFGVPYFTPLNGKEDNPYKRDSKFGQVTYSVPRFFDMPEEPPKTPPPSTPPPTVPPQTPPADVPPPTPPKEGPWWTQDIVNFVGTMTDENNRYEPSQGKVALQTPGYVTEDPTRRLAANQEQMARMQDQAMNTTDGNVGLASMLGASGQGFANAANVLGEVENRNVGIVNQAYDRNAQIVNQETLANENARQKYVQDMAVLNQQEDNADQQLKWRQIAAFNNGTTNYFRKKQMEQVLFPTVYTDPISGDVSFSGNGRNPDPTMIDTYSPAYAGNTTGATGVNVNSSLQAYQDAYDQALPTMGPEKAKEYALSVSRAVLNQQGKVASGMGMTPRQQYAQMAQQGLTLPAPLPGGEYGGIMTFPWQDID